MKVSVRGAPAGRTSYWLWCPACDDTHRISDAWGWNGDTERPTFTPSVLVGGVQWSEGESFHKPSHSKVPSGGQITCHSFVTDGVWNYLGDCTHDRVGQSVPMIDLPDWLAAGS